MGRSKNTQPSKQQPAKEHRGQDDVATKKPVVTKKHHNQDAVAADDRRDARRPLQPQRYQCTFHLAALRTVGSNCKREQDHPGGHRQKAAGGQEDIDCMLKKQREQNDRDMQNILGDVARKSYTKR
jgi:hypothetical protein